MELSPIKIRIKGLSVYAHHGVFDFEKAYGQEFLIDAEVSIKPNSTDDLASTLSYAEAVDRLTQAQTAYGAINSVHEMMKHPQLRTRPMAVQGQEVQMPAVLNNIVGTKIKIAIDLQLVAPTAA